MKNLFFLKDVGPMHGAFAVLFLFLCMGMAQAVMGQSNVYAVSSANVLVRFNTSTPGTLTTIGPVTNLQSGENILGIDFRPATGELYALGSTSRLYTINKATGAATQVGTAGAFTLSGTDFGFDFNPVVDRIRIVSNTGQNLRVNPNDGTLSATDTPLNPGTPLVVAAAYTNNFAGTTSTTLYDIDSGSDSLFIQNPPNNGTLNLVGPLGINVTNEAGFDITAGSNNALAALQLNGATSSGLYRINLTTGAATLIGPIGNNIVVRDIAIGRNTASGAATATLDFNGDGRTDYTIFRNTNNTWFISPLPNGSFSGVQFGLSSSDVLTPGDYDGDGKTDISVWRISEGRFFVLRSSDFGITHFQWGIPGDEPVARDYDGDGKTDFAVVRRQSNGLVWYIVNSSNNNIRIEQFGISDDIAAPGDYDGDGRFDLAVYRGQSGQPATFFVQGSTAGVFTAQWGLGGDIVVPGDYDGDGKTDFAVVRAGTPYVWYVLRSSDRSFTANGFGTKPDFMTQGDYDGDGKTDIAVWNPITGTFSVLRSSTQATTQYQFGLNGDYPVANIFTH